MLRNAHRNAHTSAGTCEPGSTVRHHQLLAHSTKNGSTVTEIQVLLALISGTSGHTKYANFWGLAAPSQHRWLGPCIWIESLMDGVSII